MSKTKSYARIAALTAATGIAYAASIWIAIPLAIVLSFFITNHCDSHKC